ncbi:hypothetical protein EVAR_53629_1 [Eumeta japonica]|uniref:Histone-lysine N-methyltransferase SETMAR n=1 Tax=Eumeta variegata TaxID=151549 RepID=A0A4C1X2Q3_EUMVA|nr:hypothetical protein EVAR_53629_1 [Eumeta japonica]
MRRNNRPRRIILHHHDSSCHTSAETTRFLEGQNIKFTGHPPYSPDLAPHNFYLFPSLKNNYVVNVFRAAKRPLMRSKCTFWRYLNQNGNSAIKIDFSVCKSASIIVVNIQRNNKTILNDRSLLSKTCRVRFSVALEAAAPRRPKLERRKRAPTARSPAAPVRLRPPEPPRIAPAACVVLFFFDRVTTFLNEMINYRPVYSTEVDVLPRA